VGVPIGVQALTTLDGPLFKMLVGGLMVLCSLALMSGWRIHIKNERVALYLTGFVSGVMNGSTSLSGPPVILFLSNQDTPKDVFRASIVAYFALVGVVAVAVFSYRTLITREVLGYTAAFAPAMAVGAYLGMSVSHKISEARFKQVAMGCAAVMGAILLIRNLLAMV